MEQAELAALVLLAQFPDPLHITLAAVAPDIIYLVQAVQAV